MNADADKKALKLMAFNKAQELWAGMTPSERTGIRFGMFPAAKMQEATEQGHDSRMLTVALMDCAARDGGMQA